MHGFYNITASAWQPLDLSLTGVFMGPMHVPHLAGYIVTDVVARSPAFLETNVKIGYTLRKAIMRTGRFSAGFRT